MEPCNHEESDTRMLQLILQDSHTKVALRTVDTDVLVLAIAQMNHLGLTEIKSESANIIVLFLHTTLHQVWVMKTQVLYLSSMHSMHLQDVTLNHHLLVGGKNLLGIFGMHFLKLHLAFQHFLTVNVY